MTLRNKLRYVVLLSSLAVLAVFIIPAAAAEPYGPDILAETTDVMRSESRVMNLTMTLVNDRGQERSRTVKVWSASADGEDKMMLQFLAPRDVAGTGFLVAGDDMWLYLPAIRQSRRIAGHAKTGGFMGSDLSYEDMEMLISAGFSNYDAQWTAKATEGDELTYRLRLTPSTDGSYDALDVWISQETYLPRRIDYVQNGIVVKRMTIDAFAQVEGRWTATTITMQTIAKRTMTRLDIDSVNFSETVDETLFSVRNLERGVGR